MNSDIDSFFRARIERNVDLEWLVYKCGGKNIYVAGNSMNSGSPNDIDLFPSEVGQFDSLEFDSKFDLVISKTKNAITVKHDGVIYQFCSYHHDSLNLLVESFDFAHIQIGAELLADADSMSIGKIFYTDNFVTSKLTGSTFFTGSQYPLSSLLRAFKYHKRGDFAGKSFIPAVIGVLTKIIARGFDGYEDFKDQLDAIDLGLVPEELRSLERSDLLRLFELLNRGN